MHLRKFDAILAVILLLAGCAQRNKAKEGFPLPLAFDESKTRFYAYGHLIHSPVLFSYRDGDLVINGFAPLPRPPAPSLDSSMARAYRNVPFFKREIAEGKPVLAAGQAYEAVRKAP
jgi:hypothetical protein